MQILSISTDKENDLGYSSLTTVTWSPLSAFRAPVNYLFPQVSPVTSQPVLPHSQPQTCSVHWLPLGFICLKNFARILHLLT